VQFVVDTLGVPDTLTFKALETPHEIFNRAVKNVLPSLRFSPAELGGRRVKQMVLMPFDFKAP
jgi:periplasmic protein TonB